MFVPKPQLRVAGLALVFTAITACAQPGQAVLDWRTAEAWALSNHVKLTSRDQFLRAGEAYFSPDDAWIIFQAVPIPPDGDEPDPFYSMYVAKVIRHHGQITGIDSPILISNPGTANTCGWFHPTLPGVVLFGSTIGPPATEQRAGFRVGERRYVWMFPEETEVVSMLISEIFREQTGLPITTQQPFAPQHGPSPAAPIFTRPKYDAEASWSPCGRFIMYTRVREERADGPPDADIWLYDTRTREHHPLVVAQGYDGGPFFSPDGTHICYRSDRELNDHLQLFVSKLKFEDGVPTGIEKEYALTANEHVNWGPYWHPSGEFIVYSTSEFGHYNYEVFAIESSPARLAAGATPADLRRVRITEANGADVLPVFSNDGRTLIWTAQRGPTAPGDQRPTSQVWAAVLDAEAVMKRLAR